MTVEWISWWISCSIDFISRIANNPKKTNEHTIDSIIFLLWKYAWGIVQRVKMTRNIFGPGSINATRWKETRSVSQSCSVIDYQTTLRERPWNSIREVSGSLRIEKLFFHFSLEPENITCSNYQPTSTCNRLRGEPIVSKFRSKSNSPKKSNCESKLILYFIIKKIWKTWTIFGKKKTNIFGFLTRTLRNYLPRHFWRYEQLLWVWKVWDEENWHQLHQQSVQIHEFGSLHLPSEPRKWSRVFYTCRHSYICRDRKHLRFKYENRIKCRIRVFEKIENN